MLNYLFCVGQVLYAAFLTAIFAKMMQNLCKSVQFEHYGVTPLSRAHRKIAMFLYNKRLKVLLKLHYCFICQSVWYALFLGIYCYFAGWQLWQIISLPLFTYYFASVIIKAEYFEPVC